MRTTIWSVDADGSEMIQLTTGRSASCPRWSPDGQTLAFLEDVDGESQIWLLTSGGGEARRLTDLPGGAGEPAWSPGGDRIAFAQKPRFTTGSTDPVVISRLGYREDGSGLRPTIGDRLFVVDVAAGETKRLVDGDAFVAPLVDFHPVPVWSPDGLRIVHSWSLPGHDLPYTLVPHVVTLRADAPPEPLAGEASFLMATDWSRDGSTLLLWGQEQFEGEARHLGAFVLPAEGGIATRIAARLDRNVVNVPRLTLDGDRAILSFNDRGCVHVASAPIDGGQPTTIVDGSRTAWGISVAQDRFATVVLDPTTCGEVETYRLDGSDRRRLTALFADTLPEVDLFVPEELTFEGADGGAVHGWILRPDAPDPGPLVLSIHGGPHLAWGPAFDQYHLYQQTMARLGWTVLMVNPRGSDGYGETYLRHGAWGDLDVADLLGAVDELVADGSVDPARVAVTGYSYGGYLTCLITALHDRFRAAVAGGVITDVTSSMWSSDLGLFQTIEFGSDPWDDPERWRNISPITHVRGVRCPTLILQGSADDRTPFNQAEAWFLALRAQRTPVELVCYPGASHSFQWAGRPTERIDYCRRIEAWLSKHGG